MHYPVAIQESDHMVSVTIDDFPNAKVTASNKDKAIEDAGKLLMELIKKYANDKNKDTYIPMPSKTADADAYLSIPAGLFIKMILLNKMKEKDISQVELAKRLGIFPQQVTRFMNIEHKTNVDSLQEALKVIGYEISLTTKKAKTNSYYVS